MYRIKPMEFKARQISKLTDDSKTVSRAQAARDDNNNAINLRHIND